MKLRSWRTLVLLVFGSFAANWLHAAPFAYIPMAQGVAVIELPGRTLLGTIPVAGPVSGIWTLPRNARAYATNAQGVTVIDTAAHAPVATIALDRPALAVAGNPPRSEADVIESACPLPPTPCLTTVAQPVAVIKTDTNTVATAFSAILPQRIVFNTDGTRAYISGGANDSSVDILDTGTRTFVASIATGSAPRGLALHPNGLRLYVAEFLQSTVAIVDVATRAIVSRVAVGSHPSELVLNPNGTLLFVSNEANGTVSVIDTAANSVVATIAVGATPRAIDVTPGGDFVLVANAGSSSVSVIDVSQLRVVDTIALPSAPTGVGRFIGGPLSALPPNVLTGLWWNPAESGWGVHLAQRNNTIFAAWFTYSATGTPKWYVASDCEMAIPLPCPDCVAGAVCNADFYETTGPRFFRDPYPPGSTNVTKVGLMQLHFDTKDKGAMSYVIGSTTRTVPIQRQVFRAGAAPGVDYTDLWWNPFESGWGIGITQQADVMFLAWFVYDDFGRPVWYVASNCAVISSGNSCSGALYRTTGPADPLRNASFDPSLVRVNSAGTITVTFTDANTGVMTYNVDGVTGTKTITRQLF